ncbi:unnamed protein product [Taenia asiatica]|uniref:cyclin-dependent kinase n=1 Tax=Taenia asiatica TaxID=60517 RepID=A0A0R3WF46_TAEAS|nr:unnamed protein product [Taenia asiatica]
MPKFILSYFSPIEKIGEGLAKAVYLFVLDSHGIVHKCCNRKSGHLVTVKRIKLNWSDPASHSTAISEAALLKELRHPNIVNLGQVFLDCGDIYLICEYLPLNLRSYMDLEYKGAGLPPDTVKGANLWHCAPEILLGDAVYGCGVDMWSMGCIFAELVTGDPLFCGDSGIDQLFHIFRIMGVPTEESWPGVTMLRDYNFNSFPSWCQNRLSSQNKIVRALDAKGFDLLTVISGEYVGLTAGEMPPTLVKVLEDLLSIASSELVAKKEEGGLKNEEKEGTLVEDFAFYGDTGCNSESTFSSSLKVAKRAKSRQSCRRGNGIQLIGSTSHTN